MQEVKKVIAECVSVLLEDTLGLVVHVAGKVANAKGMDLIRPRLQIVDIALVLVVQLLQHREVCALGKGTEGD